MKNNISETIKEKTLLAICRKENVIDKYSLKERDFKGTRFNDNSHILSGFYEILSITKPNVISEIDERFLKSGVDLIVTNTLKANRFHLEKLGLEDITYELNLASAKIVRDKVSKYSSLSRNKPRYSAGGISSLPDDIQSDVMESIYAEQIKALLAGKVDVILFNEFDNSKSLNAGLFALNSILEKREKTIEVIIISVSSKLTNWFVNNNIDEKFDNVNVIIIGQYPFDRDSMLELTKDKQYKLAALYDFSNIENSETSISYMKDITQNDKYRIIGFDAGIKTKDVEKLSDFLSNTQ